MIPPGEANALVVAMLLDRQREIEALREQVTHLTAALEQVTAPPTSGEQA